MIPAYVNLQPPLPWTLQTPLVPDEEIPRYMRPSHTLPVGTIVPASATTWIDEDGYWLQFRRGRDNVCALVEDIQAACGIAT